MKYVLITAVRNEARFIEGTMASVVSQTALPERWVIVDDGSTDGTAEIVRGYQRSYPWIEMLQMPPRRERSFAGKALAVNAGLERAQNLEFDVVGNLDADVSFEPHYLAFLLEKFSADPQLGVAGTPFTEEGGYDSRRDSFEGENFVAGPCQLFRRSCFTAIGGYAQSRAGGVDWIAVMTARMQGWRARSFPEKRFHHHRSMGTAERGRLVAQFSYGEKDYYLGGSPVWQVFRVMYRMGKRPFIIDGLALFAGYSFAALRRIERPVSPELVRFHRKEQMDKLKAIIRGLFRFKKVDNFSLTTADQSGARS
ncbi:MAG TPA: glycosyltransferase family 2 protein [Chthoniobacterales bacterium]|jgi:glycosyltransferase involved in cell wall biosynthesis|nr:glycosyltransferase family 2 protein [Chthoniobacterales bacterium]